MEQTKTFSQEELDQILAPIALYPDSLLAQILMASTYPLEVVQAERWAKANSGLQGDALTNALEGQSWDPSVKSLVNFPQILTMMNEKVDWTQKLGDAFLAQQKDVMATVQKLRAKAKEQGNLESTEQQQVIVEKETQTIIIEPADPQVVYVPTYNPSVVYGSWWYPSYPPYYYYPPTYVPGAALFSFGVGVAAGAAWGYAWGGCNWGHGEVDVNINRNLNVNSNINRTRYQNSYARGQAGSGSWQHNPAHRQGVAYRDQNTAQQFNRGANTRDIQAREQFRGRAESGRQDIARGGAGEYRGDRGQAGRPPGGRSPGDRPQATPYGGSGSVDRGSAQQRADRSAFSGYEKGSQTRNYSSRGNQSMSSSRSSGSASRSSGASRGGGGGGGRGGGGGGRGGGGRR
jgi:uncharacterized membrane protein YgcG